MCSQFDILRIEYLALALPHFHFPTSRLEFHFHFSKLVNAAPTPSWVVLGTAGTLWIQGKTAKMKVYDPAGLGEVSANDFPYAMDRKYGVTPDPDTIAWQEIEEDATPSGNYGTYYDNLYDGIRSGAPLLVEPVSVRRTYAVLDRVRRGTGF